MNADLSRLWLLEEFARFEALLTETKVYGSAQGLRECANRMRTHVHNVAGAGPTSFVETLADRIQAKGRKAATGEPLFFDRLSLTTLIRSVLDEY